MGFKRGNKVFVCDDGKWSRRVVGEIINTHNGHHIQIRFMDGEVVSEFWAKRLNTVHYRNTNRSINHSKHYSFYGGYGADDYAYYSVHKFSEKYSLI